MLQDCPSLGRTKEDGKSRCSKASLERALAATPGSVCRSKGSGPQGEVPSLRSNAWDSTPEADLGDSFMDLEIEIDLSTDLEPAPPADDIAALRCCVSQGIEPESPQECKAGAFKPTHHIGIAPKVVASLQEAAHPNTQGNQATPERMGEKGIIQGPAARNIGHLHYAAQLEGQPGPAKVQSPDQACPTRPPLCQGQAEDCNLKCGREQPRNVMAASARQPSSLPEAELQDAHDVSGPIWVTLYSCTLLSCMNDLVLLLTTCSCQCFGVRFASTWFPAFNRKLWSVILINA